MIKIVVVVTALLAALSTGIVYALNQASTAGSLSISTISWLAATVPGAGDGNPQAPYSYTLNPGNSRRNFAYVKNFGTKNLSSVSLSLSGGPANRTVTVASCSGTWNTGTGACSGTINNIIVGSAAGASGSVGPMPVGGSVHIRITCPQNASGQIVTVTS